MIFGILLSDVGTTLANKHTQLQFMIYAMMQSDRQAEFRWGVCEARPRLQEEDRGERDGLATHLYHVLQIVFANANDLREWLTDY